MILDTVSLGSPFPIVALREPGTVLDGKYEILRRLTGGGMSEVYLVRHLHLDERRVIKVLKPEDAADPASQARFLRAARTASQIKHRNVAILYDYSSLPDGSFYMVWEYVDGQDVGRWLDKQGPFPLEVALDLGIQGLRGLESIHSHGVIHRDISPDNLMLAQDSRGRITLKIIDLGLAKNLAPQKSEMEVTQVGMFMGKLRYCSPEQAGMGDGLQLDHRSDLYSFAAVLYEMISGQAPFDSETPHGFVFKRLTEEPLSLINRVPGLDVPKDVDEVLRIALERDRDRRFPSAVRMIEALERASSHRQRFSTQQIPVSSENVPPPPPRPATTSGTRTGSQLSKQERDELLNQINRASDRMSRTRDLMHQASDALSFGNLDHARRVLHEIETIDARAKGLAELKDRLTKLAAEAKAPVPENNTHVLETETLLLSYLDHQQLALARLAFESLTELAPHHPRLAELEARLRTLASDSVEDSRFEKTLITAREALSRGDLRSAERGLVALRRSSTSATKVAALEAELDKVRGEQQRLEEQTRHRESFNRHLAAGHLAAAEGELSQLTAMGGARVTLDLLRQSLYDARRLASVSDQVKAFEVRFADRLTDGDWYAAREVALEMERVAESHPQLSGMFAKVEALRQQQELRRSIEQGERQVQQLITAGRAGEAAMALKVLLKMDPGNSQRRRFEEGIAELTS